MARDPIKIDWNDLKSEQVEGRLREQATVRTTKSHYEKAEVVAPKIDKPKGLHAWLLQSIVYLALFGVLGGVLGWTAGEIVNVRPDRVEEAQQLIADYDRIARAESLGRYTAADAVAARKRLLDIGADNALFNAHLGKTGTDVDSRTAAATVADRAVEFRADLLLFAISGLFIAAALAAADRIVEQDWRGAAIDLTIGSVVGVIAGVAVAFAIPQLEPLLLGLSPESATMTQRILNRSACWGLLGAILGAAPGLATRSPRRILIGIAGGLVGGAIGGALFDPLSGALGNAKASRLIGLAVIGGAAGLAMGWIENAAKQGWLRVTAGLIAGKQFILYRNPTFIGSAPMSHIYLFRDAQVGRRHAALYEVQGGYEIENLPLGGPTLVNGQPVARQRLRTGDRITVGRTTMLFEERSHD